MKTNDGIGKQHHNPLTQWQSMCCILMEKKITHIHYNDLYPMPQHKNPYPGGHEIYNFGRPFLGHHYYIFSLSDLCLGAKERNSKGIMHFHYMTFMVMPQHKNPCPRGLEIYKFGRPFLGHHYYILSLSEHFLPQNYLPLGVGGHEIYNFLSPYPKDATY